MISRAEPRARVFATRPPFVAGVNLPWLRYGSDFGANAWHPHGGLALPERRAEALATLEAIAEAGYLLVRWFVFADGRAGIRFAADGTPLGLDGWCLDDVSAALEVADLAGVRLVPVLFDSLFARKARLEGGVQCGGHRRVLADPRLCEALASHVVAPVVARVGNHPAVGAWDLFNEPEWITLGYGGWRLHEVVPAGAMRRALAGLASVVRAGSSHSVTVGLASTRGLQLVRALDLDFYCVHWYDRIAHRAPLEEPVALLGVDRPVVLGEFPTRGSSLTTEAIVESAVRSGYVNAWPWSWRADDPVSNREAITRLGPGATLSGESAS